MSLKLGEYYLVITDEDDDNGVGVTVTTFQETGDAVECVREAIEEDGISPKEITVWKGEKVKVDVSMGKVEVKFID